MRRAICFPLALGFTTLLASQPAAGQETVAHLGVAAGPTNYDLNGTGGSAVISARLDFIVEPWLVLQQSFSYFNYQPPTISRTHIVFSDTQAQFQIPGSIRPFIGIGAGGASDIGRHIGQQFTLSASAGARVSVRRAWSAAAEFRFRSVNPFSSSTRDWLIGISKEI